MEDKIAEEIKRHFDVVAEDLKDEIKLVAEGYSLLNEKIDELRKENAEEHQEILSAVKFSYAELDHRIVALEEKFADIEKRVSHLETVR